MIKFSLYRFRGSNDCTLGTLSEISDTTGVEKFSCFSLEDQFQRIKVPKETRIPAGVYKLALRDAGPMNEKYRTRFGNRHKGMLWLKDVPGFEWIYIHPGNTDDHTEGCILVGESFHRMPGNGRVTLVDSTSAYLGVYDLAATYLQAGRDISIQIIDGDRP